MMGWQRSNKTWTRMISLLMILALLFTAMPVSLAAGNDDSGQLNAQRKIVLSEEATLEPTPEPTPTPDVTETPVLDPTPDPGASEPTVTPEESVSPEPSVSPSPSPLPYGFAGMPEDFVLSDKQMQAKEVMSKKDIVDITDALTPGVDYVDKQVMFWADTQEYAETVAAAYNGVLVMYSDNIALVELTSTSVMQALTIASDTTNNMPALDANHIVTLDPGERYAETKSAANFSTQAKAPTQQSWFDRPNDPYLQQPSSPDYQWMHDAINTYEAWGVTTGSAAIKVAVIDTGVRTTHEDLAGKVTVVNMTDATGKSNDDTDGHGTHVAGIIAATAGNGKGGAGIAPGVSILSLAAIPGGTGSDYNIALAVLRAGNAGADIINMSLGGYWYNETLDECIQTVIDHDITCIAAMGNDGSNSYCYPAAYDGVIAVAAVNADLTRANFSNYGPWADIAAPGVDIMSSVGTSNTAYESWDGTSMATPVVSGVAALYLSKTGRISPAALEKKLESCVNKSGSGSIGAGVIDASKLFSADKTPPMITVKNTFGTVITNFSLPIPLESTLTIEGGAGGNNAKMILYTIDGSMPTVKNGEVVNGTVYSGQINLSTFPSGKPITFKAVCISGMGIMSTPTMVKFTLSLSSAISDVTVAGVNKLTAGGKATYTAAVLPTSTVSQKVLWTITTRSGAAKATISATGVLSTAVNDGGTLTIRATSAINPAKVADITVTVEAIPFLKLITLNTKTINTNYSSGSSATYPLEVLTAINALNATVANDSFLKQWSSSNTKVATVAQDGVVSIVGSGSAIIKCLALDGSGKYACCTVNVAQSVESLTVIGQTSIAPGKTVAYKAVILPANAKVKAVTWSLSGAPDGVTISPTSGAVKVLGTVPGGDFFVQATALDGSAVYNSIHVGISPLCTGISLTSTDSRVFGTSASMFMRDTDATPYTDNLLQLGYSIVGNNTAPVWSSSNPTIASVNQEGLVTGLKVGSVTITCTTQDGSGRKAAMKVNVLIPVESVSVTGQLSVVPGKTAAFKATVLQSNASIKAVKWSLEGAPTGVSISTSGVVKVASTTWSGSFKVRATAMDGTGLYGDWNVSIAPASSSVVITSAEDKRVVKNNAGAVLSATLFPLDVDSTLVDDPILQLGCSINGNSTAPVWISSNPTIVSVDQTGLVTALKSGVVTITCATQDGSGRKAAIKVSVIIPTSYLTVGTKMPLMEYAEPTIAFGKSAVNTVAFGDTYGVPTIKQVKWDFEVLESYADEYTIDVTASMKSAKRVSISSSGVLTVSSAMQKDFEKIFPVAYLIVVTATAMDGSGVSDSITYWPQPATNTMAAKNRVEYFSPDNSDDYMILFNGDSTYSDFTVTSSNPKVAGMMGGVSFGSNPLYPYYVPIYTGIPGTAIITIKANDGTNKYATVTIYVGYWG